MKETIILSSINDRELLRTLSLNESKFFNVRILNSVDLALETLIRNGTVLNLEKISETRQICIIYNLLKDIEYFKDSNFIDARNITNAINYSRKLCRGNEEEKLKEVLSDGEFKEKNKALLDVYAKYIKYLDNNNLIDSIGIINKCLKESKSLDAEIIIFKETPLEPLEEELLKCVSNNNYQIKTIREFGNKEYKELSNITYDDAYGSVNEIEYVLGYIAKNKFKYEDCTLALIDSSYVNHLLGYRDTFNIPMSFGLGVDLSLSNAYKVLTLLNRWDKGYNALDVLKGLIDAPEFETSKFFETVGLVDLSPKDEGSIISTVGNLRLSTTLDNRLSEYKNTLKDEDDLKLYEIIKNIAKEFEKGYIYIIQNYTRIENPKLEYSSITCICSYLEEFFNNVKDGTLEDAIDILSSKKINRELSKEGSIHITDLNGALSSIRKHLFVLGLNAKNFPGTPKEDYLLLDSDLERFNEEKIKTSNLKIKLNKELLFNVLDNASAFNSDIHLSYAGYNLSDLKQENPSSLLFEIYKKENGEDSKVENFEKTVGIQHKYFDEDISSLKNVGEYYLNGVSTIPNDDSNDVLSKAIIKKVITPSSAEKFFTCPKRFYLTQVLGIEEPDEDDPFKTLPANDEGTLIHECMEDYGDNPDWSIDDFMKNAEDKLNNYFKKRIPMHSKNIDLLKANFLKMAKVGYENDPHNKVFASEMYLGPYSDPVSGLKIGGRVDRIEELANGKYTIVDYKTYKDFKNENNDVDSCFQVLLYAYILEKKENKQVENCEYRYLRNPETISCVYDSLVETKLHEKLNEIKEALETGNFRYAEDPKKDCKYCKLGNICGKNKITLIKEEEDGQ